MLRIELIGLMPLIFINGGGSWMSRCGLCFFVFVDNVVRITCIMNQRRPFTLPHDNLYRSIEYEKDAQQE